LKDTPYAVLLGRLGVTESERLGLLNSNAFRALPSNTTSGAGCAYFAETGHTLCGRFHEYFRAHGLEFDDPGFSFRESLALFGYPISEPYTDPSTGLVVQYFERARFEAHPENAAPYDVLLGLLGTDAVRAKGWIR
jgi:spore germination protein